MWDAMACEPAVFEPEEVAVLHAAFTRTLRRCRGDVLTRPEARVEIARLVHNLGRSRLRLRKSLCSQADARALADETAEVFRYLVEAPDIVPVPGALPRCSAPDRRVSLFAQSYRIPPSGQLR